MVGHAHEDEIDLHAKSCFWNAGTCMPSNLAYTLRVQSIQSGFLQSAPGCTKRPSEARARIVV